MADVACPNCRGPIPRPDPAATHLQCPGCGAKLRVKASAPPPADEAYRMATPAPPAATEPAPAPRKKKKRKTKPAQTMAWWPWAAAGGGLVLLAGVIVAVTQLGGGGPGGGSCEPGAAVVVVDSLPAAGGQRAPEDEDSPAGSQPVTVAEGSKPPGPGENTPGFLIAPRPPAVTPPKVVANPPTLPAAWSVPPPKPAAPTPVAAGLTLADRPVAIAGGFVHTLRLTPNPDKPGQPGRLFWVRYDPASGAAVGDPVLLWDEVALSDPLSRLKYNQPLAAVSADGRRFALVDYDDSSRVDVWEAGARVLGLVPDPKRRVEGVGWSPGGLLLTVGDGQLTGWRVPAGEPAFAVAGGYTGRLHPAPGGGWAVVGTFPGHVDVLDTETGRCLGRADAVNYGWHWAATALTGDGKLLYRRLAASSRPERVWDMTTGKRVPGPWVVPADVVIPVGATLLITQMAMPTVFDFPTRQTTACDLPVAKVRSMRLNGENGESLTGDGAGGLWACVPADKGTAWRRVVDPAPPAENWAFAPPATVRVELDLQDRAKAEPVARGVAEALRDAGFTVGPNGWKLSGVLKGLANGRPLTDPSTGRPTGVRLMSLELLWTLTDPAGATAWTGGGGSVLFDPNSTKYKNRSRSDPGPMSGQFQQTIALDFGGEDPKEAMVAELRGKFIPTGGLPAKFPMRLRKTDAGYEAAPAKLVLDVGP